MRPSICYVASYDPAYSRNTDTIRAFEKSGARVELVAPGMRHRRAQPARAMREMLFQAVSQLVSKPLLVVDVALRLQRCHVLVVGYFGQVDMLLLGPLAKRLGKPVIFNPLVTLTDTLVEDRELVSPGSPGSSAIAWLDRRALTLADLVMVDTEENANYITARFGIDRARIIVFPVGVDSHIFHPGCKPEQGAREWLDVLFYGKFIPLHGVETIVRAARIVEREHPGVRFELIGTGQDYRAARLLAASLGTQRIKWTDWLPYKALGARLREADVALGVFSARTKAARVIPNKVHQALACGVPVVTRRSPAIERLLQDGESAFLVPPEDPEALARALLRLAADPDLRLRTGARGREVWQEFASEERLAAKAREALERVGLAC